MTPHEALTQLRTIQSYDWGKLCSVCGSLADHIQGNTKETIGDIDLIIDRNDFIEFLRVFPWELTKKSDYSAKVTIPEMQYTHFSIKTQVTNCDICLFLPHFSIQTEVIDDIKCQDRSQVRMFKTTFDEYRQNNLKVEKQP